MDHKLNKPRVFLSHSKKDIVFIEKLSGDLRKCQINPWLDTDEIRDGKSWLKVIFEDGIPTCDVVIVYFTKNSLESKMVGREIDAALIEQLSEKGISFLPYVETDEVRAKLRSDIRSLHCRVWNETNYVDVLPSVIAEIWHSYLERIVEHAVMQEKNKRLELEIELKKINELTLGSIFSRSEDADLRNIYNRLSHPIEVVYQVRERQRTNPTMGAKTGDAKVKVQLLDILLQYVMTSGTNTIDYSNLAYVLKGYLQSQGYPKSGEQVERSYEFGVFKDDFFIWLKAYGIIERVQLSNSYGIVDYVDKFTDKMFRFIYWLEHNDCIPSKISFELEHSAENSGTS